MAHSKVPLGRLPTAVGARWCPRCWLAHRSSCPTRGAPSSQGVPHPVDVTFVMRSQQADRYTPTGTSLSRGSAVHVRWSREGRTRASRDRCPSVPGVGPHADVRRAQGRPAFRASRSLTANHGEPFPLHVRKPPSRTLRLRFPKLGMRLNSHPLRSSFLVRDGMGRELDELITRR